MIVSSPVVTVPKYRPGDLEDRKKLGHEYKILMGFILSLIALTGAAFFYLQYALPLIKTNYPGLENNAVNNPSPGRDTPNFFVYEYV